MADPPWDTASEVPYNALNAFSQAVREAVKSYVQDPAKGVPFKLDGNFADFETVEGQCLREMSLNKIIYIYIYVYI